MKRFNLSVSSLSQFSSPVILAQSASSQPDDAAEISELRQQLETISARLAVLGGRHTANPLMTAATAPTQLPAPAAAEDANNTATLRGTTFGFGMDGYCEYNFTQPVGRVNLLRAYDVTSNNFNLDQVNLIVEHLPTAEERFGHMGICANDNVNSKLNVAYWLVNGANDTEDLNGYKSQAFLFNIKPVSSLSRDFSNQRFFLTGTSGA